MNRLRTRLRASIADGPLVLLDFISGGLDPRITFSRGSNATLVDSTGKITYAPANLVLRSEEFDNASWAKTNSTVTANAAVAPDGTSTADKLVENTANGIHSAVQTVTVVSGTTYAFSAYVKAAERDFALIQSNFGNNVYGTVNLSTGATNLIGGTGALNAVSVGDGWWRVSLTAASSNPSGAFNIYTATNSTTFSYTGDGTSGIFIWGAQLEPVTYQTTPSTYNATTSAAYYGPRFDYDPVTLAPKGLLIEEQRTNLLTYSEQFDNAAWQKAAATATANATTAPDGTSTADKVVATATTAFHGIYQAPTGTVASYTYSVYAKAAEYSKLQIANSTAGTWSATFDLATGATIATGGVSVLSSSIQSVGNGWYRCSITFTGAAIPAAHIMMGYPNTGATLNNFGVQYTGDGTSGLFLWGAQLELGAFATSYIPTVASTVTRSADVATMTGTNFSSWYNQSEGTIVASILSAPVNTIAQQALYLSDGTANNTIFTRRNSVGSVATAVSSGGVTQGDVSAGSAVAGSAAYKYAFAYAANDLAESVNGSAVGTDTSATIPTLSQMNLGASVANTQLLNGHIRQIAYYNTRLSNSQLQTLTAPSLATTLSLSFTNQAYTVGV